MSREIGERYTYPPKIAGKPLVFYPHYSDETPWMMAVISAGGQVYRVQWFPTEDDAKDAGKRYSDPENYVVIGKGHSVQDLRKA